MKKIFTKKIEKVGPEGENIENKINENKANETLTEKASGKIIDIMEKVHNVKESISISMIQKRIVSLTKINIIKKDDVKLSNYKYRLNNEQVYYDCSLFYDRGAYVAMGGFWNGNIIIKSLDYKSIAKGKEINKLTYIYTTNELSPTTKITIDEIETYVICANKLGNIFVYIINPEKKYAWILSKILSYHISEITSISINDNLNMFISCSKDGNCMLYSFQKI